MRRVNHLLVTGGAGFIGSAFIHRFLDTFPGRIVNLDLLTYAGSRDNLYLHPRHLFIHGDINDQELVEQLLFSHAIDAIVHFAAETHVDRSIASARPFLQANVMGTLSLLEAVRKFPHIHFHHISTDEVYGSLGSSGAFHEHSPYRPSSPYSASKAASDHLVRSFAHTYQLSTTLSHCSNNYGPRQFPEKLIPLMISNCLEGKPLPVYGRGENIRDWLYVDDHADAVWAILQKGKRGETYDIGGGEECSNLALVERLIDVVAQETGADPLENRSLIQFVEDRPGHDFRYAIDSSKITRELGWRPVTALQEGLLKTVRWHLGRRFTAETREVAEMKFSLRPLRTL
jgi:dTDP-glucose 4,6-dehydratase